MSGFDPMSLIGRPSTYPLDLTRTEGYLRDVTAKVNEQYVEMRLALSDSRRAQYESIGAAACYNWVALSYITIAHCLRDPRYAGYISTYPTEIVRQQAAALANASDTLLSLAIIHLKDRGAPTDNLPVQSYPNARFDGLPAMAYAKGLLDAAEVLFKMATHKVELLVSFDLPHPSVVAQLHSVLADVESQIIFASDQVLTGAGALKRDQDNLIPTVSGQLRVSLCSLIIVGQVVALPRFATTLSESP